MSEFFRWLGASGCCFILGMNLAFMINLKNIIWRWFIFGKGLMTTYIALDIWFYPIDWVIVFAIAGIAITSFTMAKIWLFHYSRIRGINELSKT